jgi:hypothetical protein
MQGIQTRAQDMLNNPGEYASDLYNKFLQNNQSQYNLNLDFPKPPKATCPLEDTEVVPSSSVDNNIALDNSIFDATCNLHNTFSHTMFVFNLLILYFAIIGAIDYYVLINADKIESALTNNSSIYARYLK